MPASWPPPQSIVRQVKAGRKSVEKLEDEVHPSRGDPPDLLPIGHISGRSRNGHTTLTHLHKWSPKSARNYLAIPNLCTLPLPQQTNPRLAPL